MQVLRLTMTLVAVTALAVATASAQEGEYGTIPSTFKVTQLGEAAYSMALDLPEGPGGIRPQLSLEYRHRAGDGPLGVGWRLGGLSAITRCAQTVAQDGQAREVRYDSADKYCLDGQRLFVTNGGTYGAADSEYRTEIETFRKVVAYGQRGNGPAYFIVTDRDGRQSFYGDDYGSSIVDEPTGSNRQWALYYVRDTFNNDIEIHWTTGAPGELLVDKIYYTRNNTQGLTAAYGVAFIYEDKPVEHRRTGWAWGAPVATTKRLKTIDVDHFSGQWQSVRRYELRYVPGGYAPHHSLLESVQLCGTTTCLNGNWFEYADGLIDTMGFGPGVTSSADPSTGSAYAGDFNGDGKQDVLSPFFVNGGGLWTDYGFAIYYSNGAGFNAADQQQLAHCSEYRVIELNGDGRSDLLCIDGWNGTQVPADLYFLESTATGWVTRGYWPSTVLWDADAHGYSALTGDINGDGLTDLVTGEGGGWWIRLGTGGNFTEATAVGADAQSQPTSLTLATFANMDDDQALELVVPWLEAGTYFQGIAVFRYDPSTASLERYITLSGMNVPIQGIGVPYAIKALPDINGDGLPDLVYDNLTGPIQTRLNLGNGFGAEQANGLLAVYLDVARYVDVNNDGRDDLVVPLDDVAGTWVSYNSGGTTFGASSTALPFADASSLYATDVTGDGYSDAVYKDSSETWHVHPHLVEPERISKAWDGRGNWQQLTYQAYATLDYPYDWTSPSLPVMRPYHGPLPVVTEVLANSGIGMESYSYATGVVGDSFLTRYFYWDAMVENRGRGFLGFGYFRTADDRQGYMDDQAFRHPFPVTGWSSGSTRATLGGAPINQYLPSAPVVTPLPDGRSFVHVDQETFREYELDQQLTRTIDRTRTFSTTSGAIDSETVVTTAPTGESYTTTRDPTLLDLGACLGLPDQVAVTRSGYNMTLQTRTVDNAFDATCRLQYTQNLSESNPAMQLKQSFTFDGFGNIKTITLNSANGTASNERKNEFFYDTDGHAGHLPSTIKRYISGESDHTESFTYDYSLALPLTHAADGGLTTTVAYDDLGRPTLLTRPDSTSSQFLRSTEMIGYFENSILYEGVLNSDNSVVWNYFDSYGRVVGTQSPQLQDWSVISAKRWFYDERGNLSSETQPFLWGEDEFSIAYEHDMLGRVIQENRPLSEAQVDGGISTVTYAGLATTVEAPGNPANQTTTTSRDAIGRIVRVTDSLNGQTHYRYNAFDQLVESKDPANHTTTIGYNNRGDKTLLTDPDLGAWTFPEYAVFGEVQKQVDAKSQTVLFEYDQLGRIVSRTEPDFPNGPGVDDGKTTFAYYQAGSSLGLLQEETFPDGAFKRAYEYDELRRLKVETTTIDGTARPTEYTYYASGTSNGKLERIKYPTSTSGVRVELEHVYDGVGTLWKINDVTTDATFNGGVIYQRNSTDALWRETSATLGNGGFTTLHVYDRANLAIESIRTGPSPSYPVQSLTYDWYPNGNLEGIHDLRIDRVDQFTYDNLGRLDTQSFNNSPILDLSYYADGNIDSKTGLGTYSYGSRPHAVEGISGAQSKTYSYDANGNMTGRDGDTITWFSHNRPKQINDGSSSSEFWYGTDRSRYKHVAISGGSTVTTRHFGPHFEVETRDSLTIYRHYVFAGGQAVAQYERRSSGTPADDIQYLHRDHQGSIIATTGAAGAVRQRFEYDAFGGRTRSFGSGADDTERGYTGHEHLDAVALTHMNGRVQDPDLGRFISADPFVQAPYNSQSLNRYSYAWNNPLTFVDSSGFESCPPGMTCTEIVIPPDECKSRNYVCADTGIGIRCFESWSCWVDTAAVADTASSAFGRVDDSPQGGGSCGWNCLIAASSIPQHWHDSVLAQVNYVSGGLALWNVETFGGGPVVDRSSAAYQQGEQSMAIAYTLATLGAGVYEQGLHGAVGPTNSARGSLVGVLRARALQQAGFSTRGAPLILDENLAGRGVAEALRAQGYNVRSTIEIFGVGAKDPSIRSLAETIGARVITADRGRQIGQGFGELAIQVPGQVGQDVSSIVRLLGEALK